MEAHGLLELELEENSTVKGDDDVSLVAVGPTCRCSARVVRILASERNELLDQLDMCSYTPRPMYIRELACSLHDQERQSRLPAGKLAEFFRASLGRHALR